MNNEIKEDTKHLEVILIKFMHSVARYGNTKTGKGIYNKYYTLEDILTTISKVSLEYERKGFLISCNFTKHVITADKGSSEFCMEFKVICLNSLQMYKQKYEATYSSETHISKGNVLAHVIGGNLTYFKRYFLSSIFNLQEEGLVDLEKVKSEKDILQSSPQEKRMQTNTQSKNSGEIILPEPEDIKYRAFHNYVLRNHNNYKAYCDVSKSYCTYIEFYKNYITKHKDKQSRIDAIERFCKLLHVSKENIKLKEIYKATEEYKNIEKNTESLGGNQ